MTQIAPIAEGETVLRLGRRGGGGVGGGPDRQGAGCRVIGSAGGAEKVRFVKEELGFDECFDHRTDNPREFLREGIDVYFDNVGGPQLEAAISALRRGGRIALCGAVSQYNATSAAPGPRNMAMLVGKRARLRGFIVSDHAAREGEFVSEVGGMIADGSLRVVETVVEGGLEAAPGAFIDMLRGRYLGKVVVAL